MIRPRRLILEGIGPFKERAEFMFPDTGAVLIQGNWKGSTMSSGSGKSTILKGLDMAIGICSRPMTKLKNWDSKKSYLLLDLYDDRLDKTYTLTKDPKLSLAIDGVPYTGLATGAEDELTKILGAPPELVEALVKRHQREKGKFLTDTDADNKRFLSPLLKLEEIEAAADSYSNEKDALKNQLEICNREIEVLMAQAQGMVVSDETMAAAQQAYADADTQYQQLLANGQNSELSNTLLRVQHELQNIANVRRQEAQASYSNQTHRTTIEKLQSEIATLKAQICPTCKREWDRTQSLIDEKVAHQSKLALEMKANLTVIQNAAPVLAQESGLLARQTEINQQLGQMKAPINSAYQAREATGESLRLVMDKKNQFLKCKARYETCLKEKAGVEDKIIVNAYEEELAGRNGFIGHIFDEILQRIESKINEMMARIPNLSIYTFNLSSTSTTKAGVSRKIFSKKIFNQYGKEAEIADLSGGQQAALELIADVAVRKVVMKEAGLSLGWMELDEAMDGLEPENKLPMLDLLKEEIGGLLFVIDHTTEVKEGFAQTIKVEYNGKEAYVV